MTKKLIHVLLLFAAVIASGAFYIGAITLPVKINTIIVEELKKATGKKIFIGSIRFNIFEGLALEDLVIYDRMTIIVWAKRAYCGIPIRPLFDGKITIPSVTIESAAIYVERRSDNSFNILDLLLPDYEPNAVAVAAIPRIIIKNARAIFIDRTIDPVYKERIDNIHLDLNFSPPDKVALNFSCDISAKLPVYFKFSGVYYLSNGELAGRAAVKDLDLSEFKDYYRPANISFTEGSVDAEADLTVKDDAIELYMDGSIKNISAVMDNLRVKLDSPIKLTVRYEFKDKTLEYAGKLDVRRMDLAGIEAVGNLENIKADVEFNDSRLWSENIIADAYGMRWKARVNIFNFAAPIFDIYANSEARLSVIQKMLKEEFNIKLPTDIAGKADIALAIQTQPSRPLEMNGYIALHEATISLGSGNFPIEGVTGEVQFDLNGAKWSGIKLKYRETPYVSSGSLKDFGAPKIELEAASKELSLKSGFSVHGSAVEIYFLKGRYFDSTFSAAGRMSFDRPKSIEANITGTLELELKDLDKMIKNSAGLLKMKPSGKILAKGSLNGNALDPKMCDMRAKIHSSDIVIYGLKLTDVIIDYAQAEGRGQMRSMRSAFYGGSLYASGKVDWTAKALPYSMEADAKDVKLEGLKADAGFKDKDVSGSMKAMASLTGTFTDAARLSGTGRVSIANGRLWQLDLFKGLGSLIYTSDFSDVVFSEGSCDIKLAHKGFIINNFMLKSELLDLYGSGTIGFDKTVNAMLRPEVKEEAVGYGARGAIAMAISGNTVITVTGTVEKPEFKTKADLADVMGGIANAMFQ